MPGDRRFYESGGAEDARRSAPAALRNREPIANVLADWLPGSGLVLEIASGSGEHAMFFARRFPELDWQPSDIHAGALKSIAAWSDEAALPNIRPPIAADASSPVWSIAAADAVLSINMVHISPWTSSLGLLDGAVRVLPDGGPLILYGSWLSERIETAPSNAEFDRDLKHRDTEWGLRNVEDFAAEARARGLDLADQRSMPANNLMLLFRKRTGSAAR